MSNVGDKGINPVSDGEESSPLSDQPARDVSSFNHDTPTTPATPATNHDAQSSTDMTEESALPMGPISRVGHYSLIRVIDSGGMGTVYEAIQDKPRRAVAVKLMHQGLTSRAALRRFEFESQLLAR